MQKLKKLKCRRAKRAFKYSCNYWPPDIATDNTYS